MKKGLGIWLAIGIIILLSVLAISAIVRGRATAPSPVAAGARLDAVSTTDHLLGSASAQVTLVEYGDFQCPACAVFDPMVRQLATEFGDKLAIVYRNFPLRQIHPNADSSAQAAEAAALQGKYWEMHALLYDRQKSWERDLRAKQIFAGYATELGLDQVKFIVDLESGAVKGKVEGDLQSGNKVGVTYTPSFFVNGTLIQNPTNYEGFRLLIQTALTQ